MTVKIQAGMPIHFKNHPIKCAPIDRRDAKICGSMPVAFSYSAARVLAISAALRDSQRVTVEPKRRPSLDSRCSPG